MKRRCSETGFSLITAIFLLVVVAGLIVYMTNIRVVQQNTLLYGVQGARALNAARTGIEWGIYEMMVVSVTGTCFGSTTHTIEGFNVTVTCTSSTHEEGIVNDIITYQLTSIATSGAPSTLDYVRREIQAKVSISPP